jgi:glycosyltransferase involved in cell wall biosynthesis
LRPRIRESAGEAADRVLFVDYTNTPEQFAAAADVICLPSYREGFGSVIIEAGACGVPAVSTRIYGVVDAVVENQTGLLYTPGNVDELTSSLVRILQDDIFREALATAARRRAVTEFSQDRLTREMAGFYREALLG